MLAWSIQADCGAGEEMPKMCQRRHTKQGASDTYTTTRLSLAKTEHRLFTLKGVNYLLVVNYMYASLYPGSHSVEDLNITKCYSCVEVNIL